jgi:thiamine biosynthesis lipoprotein ApbE
MKEAYVILAQRGTLMKTRTFETAHHFQNTIALGICALTLLVAGCASTTTVSTATRPWLKAPKGSLQESSVDAFGIKFIVRASSATARDAALAEIKRISDLADHTHSGSDIARISSSAYAAPVVVSPETATLLSLCQSMYEISDHKFDVSFSYSSEFNAITDWDHKEKLAPKTERFFGRQNLLLDPGTNQVRMYNRKTKLNLNGMIRGYAAAKAIDAMTKAQATGGSVIAENLVAAMGSELKNAQLFCVENPLKLGTCLYKIIATDSTRPLFVGTSASKERKGIIFDPKDTWSYRSGGVSVGGNNGAWVQFGATITSLMDDGQLETFLKKGFTPKLSAVFFDQTATTKIRGSLLPYAKLAR